MYADTSECVYYRLGDEGRAMPLLRNSPDLTILTGFEGQHEEVCGRASLHCDPWKETFRGRGVLRRNGSRPFAFQDTQVSSKSSSESLIARQPQTLLGSPSR